MNLLNVFNSIVETGGASYCLATGDLNPDRGYMVSRKKFGKVYDFYPSLNKFQDQITDYLNKSVLNQIIDHTTFYIGFWVNEGKIYIDLSEQFFSKETALAYAIKEDQKAIWDCENKKEIFIPKKVSHDPDIETDKKY